MLLSLYHFNPCLREGGDYNELMCYFLCIISIHASEKEATRRGGHGNGCLRFQSTPPRRRRPGDKRSRGKQWNFNPRLREGGDVFFAASASAFLNFNPRLREGGDASITTLNLSIPDFNPRLREGGDNNIL